MRLRLILGVCVIMVVWQWGHAEERRVKRFPARTMATMGRIVGRKALKTLITGGTKLKYDSPKKIQYVKAGGWARANIEVGNLEEITRGMDKGNIRQWTNLVTDKGTKYGKVVGDRFVELFHATKVHPPMVRISKMRYRKIKKDTVLEEPVEIKYLDFSGGDRRSQSFRSRQ